MRYRGKLIGFLLVLLMVASALAFSLPAAAAQGENRAQPGTIAPSFSVQTLENATVSPDDYRGKVLVLEFFASWCHICKDTTPEFKQVRENFSSENLAILSVESSPPVPLENVREFKSEYGGDWSFAKAPEVADRYGVEGYPTIFVIDPDGYIAFKAPGSIPPDVLDDVVSDLLKGQEVPEKEGENQAEISDVIIDVKVEPENAGGIVAASLEIKKNGAPLFTFRARPNSSYEFENWGGEDVPENQRLSPTLEIVPAPGAKVTANFAPVEEEPGGGEAPSGLFGAFGLVSFTLGAVVAGCLGVLGSYLVWGRKETKSEED